jgi:hypothetical protein
VIRSVARTLIRGYIGSVKTGRTSDSLLGVSYSEETIGSGPNSGSHGSRYQIQEEPFGDQGGEPGCLNLGPCILLIEARRHFLRASTTASVLPSGLSSGVPNAGSRIRKLTLNNWLHSVEGQIVSGLKYLQVVKRAGLSRKSGSG